MLSLESFVRVKHRVIYVVSLKTIDRVWEILCVNLGAWVCSQHDGRSVASLLSKMGNPACPASGSACETGWAVTGIATVCGHRVHRHPPPRNHHHSASSSIAGFSENLIRQSGDADLVDQCSGGDLAEREGSDTRSNLAVAPERLPENDTNIILYG